MSREEFSSASASAAAGLLGPAQDGMAELPPFTCPVRLFSLNVRVEFRRQRHQRKARYPTRSKESSGG